MAINLDEGNLKEGLLGLVVALVELEEGTRLVANVSGITPETAHIGMAVEAGFEDFDDELSHPVFHPATDATAAAAADETRTN